jgi:hypothetical protein
MALQAAKQHVLIHDQSLVPCTQKAAERMYSRQMAAAGFFILMNKDAANKHIEHNSASADSQNIFVQ